MNDLQELGAMRADVTGRRPEDLHRARDLLIAEISAAGQHGPARRAARARRLGRIARGIRLTDRHGRIWPRATLAGATAVAAAAAITAGLVAGSPGRPRPGGHPGRGVAVIDVAYVLGHAASAAAAAYQPVPLPGQFIYVTSVATELSMSGGGGCPTSAPSADFPGCNAPPVAWLFTNDRKIWQSADGSQAGALRIVHRSQQKLPWGVTPPPLAGSRVEWDPLPADTCPGKAPARGTYAFLTTLPTARAQLRAWIYQHKGGGQPADEQAWTDIGDMLREMLVPPKLAAALFQVAATIPGVTVVRHATDAAGRSGIAVARYDSGLGADAELIFDPHSYQFLGERSVMAKPVRGEGPAGTVIESTAQLHVSVVNRLPHFPSSAQGGGGTC
ncbi:MAG TPA: CU044_5270 family protein [Streptosporangiaceae bacterium]